MVMYANREVFPNTPLALVVAEVRFTDSPRLRQQDILDNIAIALEERFPFVNQMTGVVQFTVTNPGRGDSSHIEPVQTEQPRRVVLTNATGTESITISPTSFTYETTNYREFDDLRQAVIQGCNALIAANVRPALTRVGLRYIDEVRVPEPVTDVRAWGKWIDSRLVDPLAIGPEQAPVRNAQGLITYELGEAKGLNFQYAAINHGAVVEPMFLKRRHFDPGPFFVLDFDGFQDFAADGSAVPLNAEVVANILSAVHGPAGAAFQQAITNEARVLFRGGTA